MLPNVNEGCEECNQILNVVLKSQSQSPKVLRGDQEIKFYKIDSTLSDGSEHHVERFSALV